MPKGKPAAGQGRSTAREGTPSAGEGRPTAGDGRPTARERLLGATAELTCAHGIGASGVDAIAQRAEVTKRTLYQHFGSKDALVAASLEARDEPVLTGLRVRVQRRAERDGTPPVLALFDVLGRLFARPDFHGCAFQQAALELRDPGHPAHPVARRHFAGRRALLSDLLRDSGVQDDAVLDEVVLLAEGAFVVSAATGDAEAARRARAAVERLLARP